MANAMRQLPQYATEADDEHAPEPARHIGFAISITPFAHEPERDEDNLDRETDVSEHDGGELHLPRFSNKTEIRKHIECLKAEISYYEALLSGNEQAANKAREQLCNTMSDGDNNGE